MISDQLRCVFIHIPKTGGTSICAALAAANAGFREFTMDDFEAGQLPPCAAGFEGENKWGLNHFSVRYLKPKYDTYYKFAFVRNPWDLIVSNFHWWTQNAGVDFRKLQGYIIGRMGFADYVMSPYTDYFNQMFHFGLGQSFFVLDHDNTRLGVDMVGRFERLQQDFDIACDHIGLARITIPLKNSTQHAPFASYYNALTAEMVKKKFRHDLSRFGYELASSLPDLTLSLPWEQNLSNQLAAERLLLADQ